LYLAELQKNRCFPLMAFAVAACGLRARFLGPMPKGGELRQGIADFFAADFFLGITSPWVDSGERLG
jgi:hypothetical protein